MRYRYMKAAAMIVSLVIGSLAMAQQEPLNSLFWNNYSTVNPANTGFDSRIFLSTQIKTYQDYKFSVLPKWTIAEVRIAKDHAIGIQTSQFSDRTRVNSRLGLNYAYKLYVNDDHFISFGVSFATAGQVYDESRYVFFDPRQAQGELMYFQRPPIQSTDNSYAFGLGIQYRRKRLTAGFSIQNLNEPAYVHSGVDASGEAIELKDVQPRAFYGMIEYAIIVSDKVKLIPRSMVFSQARFNYINASFNMDLADVWQVGFGVRGNTQATWTLMTGLTVLKNWRLGYAYDLGYERKDRGSNEFYLTFALD